MKLINSSNTVEVLNEISVPQKFYNRLTTGVQVLDEIFGGTEMPGILQGSAFLMTGQPGAGKSTMCLQLADLLQKNGGRNTLYNVGEENKYMVKMSADRIGINGDFCLSQIDDVNALLKYCEKTGVEALFVDSLQSMRDGNLSGPKLLRSIVKKIVKYKNESDMTVFIVGHITKGGGFAGPQELKHDVDAHAHLKMNIDTGNRVFELQKNRFGPANLPYEFFLSARGLDFQQIATQDIDSKSAGKSKYEERKERVKKIITEKLIAGEKISSYCQDRFEADCSGGFWRGMLKLVCKELQNEGHKIGEVRINGRGHNFIEV